MNSYTQHELTAHGDACHQCRTLLDDARMLYIVAQRPVYTGDHPIYPGHRGGCWAQYETRMDIPA